MHACEVFRFLYLRIGGDGGNELAFPVAEVGNDVEPGPGFLEDVESGDPQIGHTVGNQFDHVLGVHKQQVEFYVPHPDGQRTLGLLEGESGIA